VKNNEHWINLLVQETGNKRVEIHHNPSSTTGAKWEIFIRPDSPELPFHPVIASGRGDTFPLAVESVLDSLKPV